MNTTIKQRKKCFCRKTIIHDFHDIKLRSTVLTVHAYNLCTMVSEHRKWRDKDKSEEKLFASLLSLVHSSELQTKRY